MPVTREKRVGRDEPVAFGRGERRRQVAAPQLERDEVRGGRRETGIAMERLFEQPGRGVVAPEMDLGKRQIVARRRVLRLGRIERDDARGTRSRLPFQSACSSAATPRAKRSWISRSRACAASDAASVTRGAAVGRE